MMRAMQIDELAGPAPPASAPDGLLTDVPLAPRTTLEVGGSAQYFLEARSAAHLRRSLAWARAKGLPVHVLGGGSNVLFADAGFAGLVVRVATEGVRVERVDGSVELSIGAGEDWPSLVARTVAEQWAGIECLSGIPGSVGAAPIQNIGAYGQEVGEVLVSVEAIDRLTGEACVFDRAGCGFGYRHSRFKSDPERRHIITGVRLRLAPGGAATVRYGQLAKAVGALRSLDGVAGAVLALRRSKSMVRDPADPNRRSAGSFFLNPVLEPAVADAVAAAVAKRGIDPQTMPRYPAPGGQVKLAAAWLIERAGMSKGYGEGPVGLSSKHTLALINRGSATASDIVAFAAHVRRRVHTAFGVRLVPEPVFVGFSAPVEALLDAAG